MPPTAILSLPSTVLAEVVPLYDTSVWVLSKQIRQIEKVSYQTIADKLSPADASFPLATRQYPRLKRFPRPA